MDYQTGDIASGTIVSAPAKQPGFGFVRPDDASDTDANIYVTGAAFVASGLDSSDVGCRVRVHMFRPDDPDDTRRPYATRIERLDDTVGGVAPDEIELELFRRLAKLGREQRP